MNKFQETWWEQTCSDLVTLKILQTGGAAPCHELHYLQMTTEKIGKAYFCRKLVPPRKSHASFVKFLQALNDRKERDRIAAVLGFGTSDQMESYIRSIADLAYRLEKLAPALAGLDGVNCEYPWPQNQPEFSPAHHSFEIWEMLHQTGRGRKFMKFIEQCVRTFPDYA